MGSKLTTEEFVKRATEINGDVYEYSKVEYKGTEIKVIIICKIHGEFLQTPHAHLTQKSGCPKCSGKLRLTTEDFIEKAKQIHGCVYDYSKTLYISSFKKITIICNIHGEFQQVAHEHTNDRNGCPKCSLSKGELNVYAFLKKYSHNFICEWMNHNCIYKSKLIFDFYLPDKNVIIEYNGTQHYYPSNFYGGWAAFEERVLKDNIKRKWCGQNNIKMLEIPYWYKKYEDIEWFIKANLFTL